MKRARQIGLGILAAASLAFAASASAQPGEGGHTGPGASGQQHGQGQHAGMQARMAQRMAQMQGQHGAKQGAGAGGCPMGQHAGAQGEHKH